jgi:hypothetical protein
MAGLVGKFMMSLQAGLSSGWAAARRVYEEPGQSHRQQTWADVTSAYALLWAYYNNSLFDRNAMTSERGTTLFNIWSYYKSNYSLYRDTRPVYNPTRRLVDFYAGQVYPGVISIDGKNLPDGISSAIPLSDDTPDPFKAAFGQICQWSNWQSRKNVMIRWGAALGSVLIEVVDDIERGKVTLELVWPGYVSYLMLDAAGNIKEYHLEYRVQDTENNQTYTYRKEVTKQAFRYFKDDEPFSYNGQGAVIPNPYSFVPAVWIKHSDVGGLQGSPAVAGSLSKIDELNTLASHVHDQVHKVVGAPMVLWTTARVENISNITKRASTDDLRQMGQNDQEEALILKGPEGGRVDSLAGNLPLGEVILYVDRLLGEIEQDHPELVFYRELRAMSQVTGPAAQRLVGDVASRLGEAAANYDMGSIRLFQMAIAIAGMRAKAGAWGPLNRQQQKFTPFDLNSFDQGNLDFEIMPRPLLIPTRYETALERQTFWTGVGQAVQAGAPLEMVLRDEGWQEDQLAQLGQAQVDKIKRDQLLAQEDTIPQTPQ